MTSSEEFMRSFRRSAWRLETLDQYNPRTDGDFAVWRDEGRLLALEERPRKRAWMALIDDAVREGKTLSAVHVVERPLSSYLKYELATYPENVAAGQEIRIADRGRHPELAETETVVWRRRSRRGGLAERQQETLEMEASAGVVSSFQPILTYRLLQVPGYARAVYEAFHVGARPGEAQGVAARLAHQAILHREERRRFEFLVSEAGLRWRFVPRDVMAAQLERLIEVSKLPDAYLGVLPLEMPVPVWHSHGFTIFAERAGGAEPVVHIENLTGGDNLRNLLDVARYQDAFERLRKVAAHAE